MRKVYGKFLVVKSEPRRADLKHKLGIRNELKLRDLDAYKEHITMENDLFRKSVQELKEDVFALMSIGGDIGFVVFDYKRDGNTHTIKQDRDGVYIEVE